MVSFSRTICAAALLLAASSTPAQAFITRKCSGVKQVQLSGNTAETIADGPSLLNYDNNMDCTWEFQAPSGSFIRVAFSSFALQAPAGVMNDCLDYVQLQDPSGGEWTYCGTDTPPVYVSNGNVLRVRFKTDGSVVARGFQATVRAGAAAPRPLRCAPCTSHSAVAADALRSLALCFRCHFCCCCCVSDAAFAAGAAADVLPPCACPASAAAPVATATAAAAATAAAIFAAASQ